MPERPPIIVEVFRRSPLGPSLEIVAFVAFAFLWYSFEDSASVPHSLKVGVFFIGFTSLAIGMHLTQKAVFQLQRERRAQDSARSSAPWDLDK